MLINIFSVFMSLIIAITLIKVSKSWPMNKKIMEKENDCGYSILRVKSNDKLLRYFSFIVGAVAIGLSLSFTQSSINDTITAFSLGMFFILLGLFLSKMNFDNRIEYNSTEIRQYRAFRREITVIQYSHLKNNELRNIGPLLVLNDGENELFIDLRLDGAVSLLELLVDKVSKEDTKLIKEALVRKRK